MKLKANKRTAGLQRRYDVACVELQLAHGRVQKQLRLLHEALNEEADARAVYDKAAKALARLDR